MNIITIKVRSKIIFINSKEELLSFINENYFTSDKFKKISPEFEYFINENVQNPITKTELYKILKKFTSNYPNYQNENSKRLIRFSTKYWILRGYTELEAKEKISEIQSKNQKKVKYNRKNNPRCIEYYLEKGYKEQEAKEKLGEFQSKNSPRTLKYWLKKGYSEQEAKEKLKESIEFLKPIYIYIIF